MSKIIDKKYIANSFSKAVSEYDAWACIQSACADQLMSRISAHAFNAVLDVGCGTGSLIERIIAKNKNAHIHGIDIAPGMVDCCQQKWPQLHFNVCDAASFNTQERFDTIISNFSIHWIDKVEEAVQRYFSFLEVQGIMALSVPVQGSLKELDLLPRRDQHAFPFFSSQLLRDVAAKLSCEIVVDTVKHISCDFDTPLKSLHSFKHIGAQRFNGSVMSYSVSEVRTFLKAYKKQYENEHGQVSLSYAVQFLIVRKK